MAKTLLKLSVALLAVVVVAWSGVLIHWHLRVSKSIRILEETAVFNMRPGCSFETAVQDRASYELRDAGIRALPALIRSLRPTQKHEYLREAAHIVKCTIANAAYGGSWAAMDQSEASGDWLIPEECPPEERIRKCKLLQDWWLANGRRFPWIWRPWSRGYPVPG